MTIFDNLRNWFLAPLMDKELTERLKRAEKFRDYREGKQRRFLRVKPGQTDDNLVVNFAGLVIDRSVSMLFGKGVTFDLPGEGDTAEQAYIDAVMDANKQQILLHKVAILGGEQGTCILKIIPESLPGKIGEADVLVPRLVVQDPAWVRIVTEPHDFEEVLRYVIQFTTIDENGEETAYRQTIERQKNVNITVDLQQEIIGPQNWVIRDEKVNNSTGGKWVLVDEQTWDYDFPPIVHWQNLPDPTGIYGVPDVTDDVVELQDRLNLVASNISKIIRLYAHPQRYGRNLGKSSKMVWGPDEMPNFEGGIPSGNGLLQPEIMQLEQLGDLAASVNFFNNLRQDMFDITQTADIANRPDKVGNLTNFGLRVLYTDSLAKLGVKRELYGDGLLELVRRLLIMANLTPDPGQIQWPDILPVDETSQSAAIKLDMENGLVSRQTAAQKRGYDWMQEEQRMSAEGVTANQNNSNIGAAILAAFNQGR